MKSGMGQLSENGICYTDKYNTNSSYPPSKTAAVGGASGDSMSNALSGDGADHNINS